MDATTPSSMHRSGSSHSMPVSRRNSFSRNVSATIDQFRSALDDAKRETAVSGDSPASSPRKIASFPQLIPSTSSSPVRQKTLDLGFDFGQQQSKQPQRVITGVAAAAVVTALTSAAGEDASLDGSDESENEEEDVHEIDLSVDSPVYSDVASSSSSSTPSPVNGAHTQASRESANATATAIPTAEPEPVKTRAHSISDDLPDWLQDRPLLSPSYSQTSVQQVEDDIRRALDTAASRVTRESERRDRFQHELSSAASQAVAVDYSAQSTSSSRVLDELAEQQRAAAAMPQAHPELLLLMEVVIGEGRSETIEVHVGDAPQALAAQFASKHALKPESVPKLTQLIQDQLDALNLDEFGFFDDTLAAAGAPSETHQQTEWSVQPPPAPMPVPHQHQQQQSMPQQQTEPLPYFQEYVEPPDTLFDTDAVHTSRRDVDSDCEKQEREYSRAMNYQSLMAKYGHYSQHSGKVNPSSHERGAVGGSASTGRLTGAAPANTSSTGAARGGSKGALTFRNIQLAEHTRDVRRHTLSSGGTHHHHASSSTSKHRGKPPAVFDRLYALAETKDKWIRRAQNAKQRELEKEQAQRKVEMAAKSRDLIAHRSSGGYAHIGERLHDEALSDLAKKDRLRAQRAAEREEQIDWMCPKCAFVNQHSDDVCKNVVAQPAPLSNSSSHEEPRTTRRESIGACNDMGASEPICGQRKPEQLFRPTLLASSASIASAVNLNKERAARIASIRRERSQQAIEDEFRQACPFKPTINEVSSEIVRERLENDARASSSGSGSAAVATTTTANGELRRKDPHLALYEDSFTVRANRQAREDEYLRQYSFKPDIGVNALWVSGEDVVERLAVSKYQELEKKRQALYDKYAPDRDPTSGRAFFKPETGRAPAFSRNERGLPIGAFLYESHREQQEYHRRLLQQSMDELQQQRQQGFVSEASRQALAARKAKTFRRIFDALVRVSSPSAASGEASGNGDSALAQTCAHGAPEPDASPRTEPTQAPLVVTPSHVQLTLLPREIAQVVPIVFELANHEAFTYEQFATCMDKLMTDVPGFTYTQVLFLTEHLRDGKSSRVTTAGASNNNNSSSISDELTFHPTIDRNSAAIAKKHGRADRSKVFHALHQYCDHYKDRKAQIQKQQQREFERLHPFKPHCVAKQSKHLAAGFYDKLKQQQHAEEQQAQQTKDAPPLHTALANARPYVRPIDSDAVEPSALETRSSSGSSSQFFDDLGQHASSDEDADLTSRVLAALDELPSQLSSALATSSAVSSDAPRHAKLLLTPEDAGQLHSPEKQQQEELKAFMRAATASEVHPLRASPMSLDPHKPRVQRTRTWDAPHYAAADAPSSSSSSSSSRRLVLYALVGEELEPVEEGKNHSPDTNWNAFVLHIDPNAPVRLGDIQRAFPLGDAYHFAFRNELGVFLDLTNPSALVPQSQGRKIIARVTPLIEAPEVEYIATDALGQSTDRDYDDRDDEDGEPVYAEHRAHDGDDTDEYHEFQSSFEQDEDDAMPVARGDERRSGHSRGNPETSSSSSSSYPSQRARHARTSYDEPSGERNAASAAAKDAQAFLRKQTEQAYDFAKKISMEDAKKGASETAKKAKKWGGSLLSSISASISSATSTIKNETIQVGGITVTVVRPVAEGAFAQVLLVRSTATNETFALKRVLCQSEDVEKDVHMELQVFRSVKHLNIMPLVEFAEARQQALEFYFLCPYFERGSLWDSIEAARNSSSPLWPFTQRVALHLFHGICAGVLALHRAGFCHRDLKPHNILLSSSSSGEDYLSYIPVVTDFGSCAPIRVEVRSRRNSLDLQDEANRKSSAPYRAPELFEPTVDAVVDGQSDVWSLGCILYAMAFGGNPFEHPREGFMKLAAMNGRVSFPPEQAGAIRHRSAQFSHEFCDFIRDMLHVNPEERPSVLDALEFTEELLHDDTSGR